MDSSTGLFAALTRWSHRALILWLSLFTLALSLPGLSSIQVIDRDEARYAQASVQMVESGDYVNIRFQDQDRHKKPVGIYWAQSLSLAMFSEKGERKIWAHRLVSVLAGMLAVWGTYWAGLSLYDRRYAFIAAISLSVTLLFVFESHIAKTDAAICASAAWIIGAIIRLRRQGHVARQHYYSWILWCALGIAILIKGPIIPMVLGMSLIFISIGDKISVRHLSWMWRVFNPLGIILFGVIVIPWFVMIYKETGGAFFSAAFGGDLAPKLSGAQEQHGGWPGYYLLTIWVSLWPICIFLPLACAYGFRRVKSAPHSPIAFLMAWIVPFWIMLELIPTKLPHYVLPLFPALVLLITAVFASLSFERPYRVSRRIGVALFLITSLALVFIVMAAEILYGAGRIWLFIPVTLAVLTTLYAVLNLSWHDIETEQLESGFISVSLTGLILSTLTYGFIMPNLTELRLADRLKGNLEIQNIALPREGGPLIRSPHFSEPSLIYNLGGTILLGAKADDYTRHPLTKGQITLIDLTRKDGLERVGALDGVAKLNGLCLKDRGRVDGLNYSKGDEVKLSLFQIETCPEE